MLDTCKAALEAGIEAAEEGQVGEVLPVGVDHGCLCLDALPEDGQALLVLVSRKHGLLVRDQERRYADVLQADHLSV